MALFRTNPAFRALGKGYYNKLPNFPATSTTGNGLFRNTGLSKGDRNYDLWTFVTAVETGWAIAGDSAQTALSRTFYPRNLSQAPITIAGVVANLYEYDRLVEFVSVHQRRACDPLSTDNIGSKPLVFSLKPYRVPDGGQNNQGAPTYRFVHQGMLVAGYIQNITAGQQQFVNAPTWQMDLMVSEDYLDPPVHTQAMTDQLLRQAYVGQLITKLVKGSPTSNPSSTATTTPLDPNNMDWWGNLNATG